LVRSFAGVVLYVHCVEDSMDDWSLVVPYEPFGTPALVCLDDMGEHCMGVYGDSPEAHDALSTLHIHMARRYSTRSSPEPNSVSADRHDGQCLLQRPAPIVRRLPSSRSIRVRPNTYPDGCRWGFAVCR
jgi:hypothetical protein